MAAVFQQLRSSSANTPPGDLEPGQLAFNLADSKGYIGNGTNAKTKADGSAGTPSPTAGKGWIEFNLKASDIAALLTGGATPSLVSDSRSFTAPVVPTAGQVLTWNVTANGGAGGYVPATPGKTAVYSVANDLASLNSGGSLTADMVAGLIAGTAVTAKTDLHAGDAVIVTDSGNKDASANIGPGSYLYDGTNFLKQPGGGGGASNLGDLLNVNTATSAVSSTNQVGFLVRDGSVGTETSPGAYKVTTSIDAGTY